jgi:pre-mRNA-splicing factor CWC22
MIEVLFAVRKDQFKAHPAVQSGLDLVDENDQYTHMLTLDDPCEPEPMLGKILLLIQSFIVYLFFADVFKYDEQYEENEEKYKEIRRTILDESSGDDESSSAESDNDEEGDGKKDDVDEDEQIDPVESK